jgi:hypothetical protein
MSLDQIDLPCPMLAITGVPCPLCGGTRAFVHAAQLQSSFLDYNAVWVFVALLGLAVAGAALLTRRVSPERYVAARAAVATTPVAVRAGAALVIVATAWAWAIAHTATIAA